MRMDKQHLPTQIISNSDYTQPMKYILLLVILSNGLYVHAEPPIAVKIGMYPFAPFVEEPENSDEEGITGMSIDLMQALNRIQRTYTFEAVVIPPKRRYQSYRDGHYDVILYESKAWGWAGINIDESNVFQVGSEVYVALNKPDRTQAYFEQLDGKRMIGITGFHYGFADFNADEEYLAEAFNMVLTQNNTRSLNLLLKDRGDIIVITNASLQYFLLKRPELKTQLLISNKIDQKYQHTVMVRPNISPSIKEINSYLDLLTSTGELAKIRARYQYLH